MNGTIAFTLCIIFIIWIFRVESKRKADVSSALWVPFFWLLMIGSRSVSQWLSMRSPVGTDDVLSGNPIDQVVISAFLLSGLYILSKRKIAWERLFKNNLWIVLWFLYLGVSIAWSDFPGAALRKWVKGSTTYIMVLVVITDPNPFESIKTLIRRCAYILMPLSIVLIKYFPDIGIAWNEWGAHSLAGVAIGKNQLGRLCLTCGIIFISNIAVTLRREHNLDDRKDRYVNIVYLIMIVWLLKASDSATSLGSLMTGTCIYIILGFPIIRRNVKNIGKFMFLGILGAFILWASTDIDRSFVHGLGRNMTFTERTHLWEELLNMRTNPVLGTGYDSFWIGDRVTTLSQRLGWAPNEAHNGYLEIYLELGFIGLLLIAWVLISAYRKICNSFSSDFEFGRFRMTFLIIFMLYNVTEANVKDLDLMWFIFLLIAIEYSRLNEFHASGISLKEHRINNKWLPNSIFEVQKINKCIDLPVHHMRGDLNHSI